MTELYKETYNPAKLSIFVADGEIKRGFPTAFHVSGGPILSHVVLKTIYAAKDSNDRWYEISERMYLQLFAQNQNELAEAQNQCAINVPHEENPIIEVCTEYTPPTSYASPSSCAPVPNYTAYLQNNLILANIAKHPADSESPNPSRQEPEEAKDPVGICGNFKVKLYKKQIFVFKNARKIYYHALIEFCNTYVTAIVDSDEACDPKWVQKATDCRAYLERGKKQAEAFAKHMQALMAQENIPTSYFYDESGWKKLADHHVYLHADGAIGDTTGAIYGNEQCKIYFDKNKVGTPQTFQSVLKILDITKNTSIMSVIFAYLHTSILTSLFADARFPVKFMLAIIGLTNSKKTSLAVATLKFFNTNTPSPDITFSSTPGGIEVALSKFGDAVLVIDDLMPATTRSRQNGIDAKFDDIARAIGDRTPKKRMHDFAPNGNTKSTEYVARCCGAITGEHIRGVQSALARTVVLNIERNDVIGERLLYFQQNYWLLPTHLVDFIAYISQNYDNICQFIHDTVPTYRNSISVKMPRLAEAYSILLTTLDVMAAYIRERKFLNQDDLIALYSKLQEEIKKEILHNDFELAHQDPGLLILIALQNAICTKQLLVIHREDYQTKDNVILCDENMFFVRADDLYVITCDYCRKYNIPIALTDKKAVITALERLEVLSFTKERARKLPNNTHDSRRYLYIKKDMMYKLIEDADKEVE